MSYISQGRREKQARVPFCPGWIHQPGQNAPILSRLVSLTGTKGPCPPCWPGQPLDPGQTENLSTFRKVGRQCIFHFKISASRDDWLRFFFYPFSFACILGMEHVQPWETGRDWKSNMIGQIHMHRVACRMEVSNFKLVFLSIVSSNFNSV